MTTTYQEDIARIVLHSAIRHRIHAPEDNGAFTADTTLGCVEKLAEAIVSGDNADMLHWTTHVGESIGRQSVNTIIASGSPWHLPVDLAGKLAVEWAELQDSVRFAVRRVKPTLPHRGSTLVAFVDAPKQRIHGLQETHTTTVDKSTLTDHEWDFVKSVVAAIRNR